MTDQQTIWDRDYAGPGTRTIWDRDWGGPGTETVWDLVPAIIQATTTVFWKATARTVQWASAARGIRWKS